MSDKMYIGNGKERKFDNGGSVISVSLEIDNLQQIYDSYGYITKTGKRCIRLKVGQRREVGKFGETHTVEVDTWKPDSYSRGNQQNNKPGSNNEQREPPDFPDDIPF